MTAHDFVGDQTYAELSRTGRAEEGRIRCVGGEVDGP